MEIESLNDLLVPGIAMLAPVLVVLIVLYFRDRRHAATQQTIRYLADKGLPVPKDLLDPPMRRRHSPLFTAITTLGSGLGLGLTLYLMMDGGKAWALGVLVSAVGLAQLVAIGVERRIGARTTGRSAAPLDGALASTGLGQDDR